MTQTNQPDKPFFISIIPNFAGRESYLAELIRGRHKTTGIEYYAMSYPLHPQGDDIYVKVKIQKESFRKLKELLKSEDGIKLGILFQTTLGHGGYWNLAPQCAIEADRIIKADGTVTHRCCPLDSRFLDYIRSCVKSLCEEHPDFTLGDDDMRMFDGTCYCEKHVRMISEMTGINFTRETLAAAVKDAGPHDPVAKAFEQAQIEALRKLCEAIRQTIDSVDPSIPCGCCIVRTRYDYAETESRELAGKTAPFLRIGNATYLEGALRDSIWNDFSTGFEVAAMKGKGILLLDESDTCPHNRFSKSARTMHAHITAGLLRGLDGGKLWLDQTAYPLREISLPYEKILAEHQGFYRQILAISRSWHPEGCVINVPPLEQNPYPAQGTFFPSHCSWVSSCFDRMGIPVCYDDMQRSGIHLLSGDQIDWYSDKDLRFLLSESALIDGPAAVKLTARGFSEFIGVKAENLPVRGNREVSCCMELSVGFLAADNTPFLTALPGTEILSEVFFSPYSGTPAEKIMPGSTFFVNKSGGKVIVSSINLQKWHPMHVVNPGRKLMYLSWLEKLGGVPCHIPEFQDSRIVCGTLPDGERVCAVFNSSYDPLPIRIVLQETPVRLSRLNKAGVFEDCSFSMAGNTLETPWTLEPGEAVICKIGFAG